MARPRDAVEAVNYQRVLLYLMELVSESRCVVTEEIIKRINAITLDGVPDVGGIPGEYKAVPNYVVNSATDEVLFRPPSPEDTRRMMPECVHGINARIQAFRQNPDDVEAHPVITAALACHKLNHIHPFCDGNGRTARAVATLILMCHGYMGIRTGDRLRPIKSLEWYFDTHRAEYALLLREADQGRYAQWLTFFSIAVLETMVKADRAEIEALRDHVIGAQTGEVAAGQED